MISPFDHLLLSAERASTVSLTERLQALRQSLQQACQQIESQITALDDTSNTGHQSEINTPSSRSAKLFETAPAEIQGVPPVGSIEKVLAPASHVQIDPLLEKATLEELNAALSQAFAQIAAKRVW